MPKMSTRINSISSIISTNTDTAAAASIFFGHLFIGTIIAADMTPWAITASIKSHSAPLKKTANESTVNAAKTIPETIPLITCFNL